MSRLIALDGDKGFAGGQALRAALTLSAVTGQGFEMSQIRASEARPGLSAGHAAVVRAAALCCDARVGGAFDGSPDLRFEPGPISPGEFSLELPGASSAPLALQTILPILACASEASRVELRGGTHVPHSPSAEWVARHWLDVVGSLGLRVSIQLDRAGFHPAGGGSLRARCTGWDRPRGLQAAGRGAGLGVTGVSGAFRVRGEVAERQRQACAEKLWEERRIEVQWEPPVETAASPGSYLYLEARFDNGRVALAALGQRGLRPEQLGERAARRLLRLLDDEAATFDAHLTDQLVVPLALALGGGSLATPEITPHLEAVVAVTNRFGLGAVVRGRRGGPGTLEVAAC